MGCVTRGLCLLRISLWIVVWMLNKSSDQPPATATLLLLLISVRCSVALAAIGVDQLDAQPQSACGLLPRCLVNLVSSVLWGGFYPTALTMMPILLS
ncbi:hypothetical protein U1Q18_019099 [Sarracenia purpurea var. burkii]